MATNEDAELVNQAVHDWLAEHGHINPHHAVTGSDGLPICAGERVMTRKNDTDLEVANRQTWTVDEIRADRGLVLVNDNGEVREVDAEYAQDQVHLAYASTIHGVQGTTARSGACVLTEGTDAAGLYVGMTRGRLHNTIHIEADTLDAAAEQWVTAAQRDRADLGLEAARREVEEEAARYKQFERPHRVLSDEELQARLADVTRQRDRAQRRLQAQQSDPQFEGGVGARVRHVERETQRWTATLEHLDRAEQAATHARQADDRATEASERQSAHEASAPRRRERAEWARAGQQLQIERAAAVAAAEAAANEAARTAGGLPQPHQWAQLRAQADQHLAAAAQKRAVAAQLEHADHRQREAANPGELRDLLGRLDTEYAALRAEATHRSPGADEPSELPLDDIQQAQPQREEHHER